MLVTDCLDAAARLARDDAESADLSVAADALRWMWRALADILGPGEGIRRGRVSAAGFTAYLRSWRASFADAVGETAALQPSKARRDARAALARLNLHDGGSVRATAQRHRRTGRGRGAEPAVGQ